MLHLGDDELRAVLAACADGLALSRAACVSRRWRRAAAGAWRALCDRDFPGAAAAMHRGVDVHALYRRLSGAPPPAARWGDLHLVLEARREDGAPWFRRTLPLGRRPRPGRGNYPYRLYGADLPELSTAEGRERFRRAGGHVRALLVRATDGRCLTLVDGARRPWVRDTSAAGWAPPPAHARRTHP